MIITKPIYSIEDGCSVASVFIHINGKYQELKYKVMEGPLSQGSEAFLAACLFPAMKIGQPLHITGSISSKLLRVTDIIQDVFHKWHPEFQKIPIKADYQNPYDSEQPQSVGCFFSGGVDSFYTLLKNQEEITKIIFVHGFDIRLDDHSLRAKVSKEIEQVAIELQKSVIEVETNLRDFSDQYCDWLHYFGAAMGSVALLLSAQCKKIYIAASETYAHLDPCGSHPLLDPLWSTENLEIVHDGCEDSRNEKIAKIAQHEIVLKKLRVCYENPNSLYNCCRCEKCLRTMVSLKAIGALERCLTFDRKISPVDISRIEIDNDLVFYHVEANLQAIENRRNDPILVQALQECLIRYRNKKIIHELRKNFSALVKSPEWSMLWPHIRNTLFKYVQETNQKWFVKELLKEYIKNIDKKFLNNTFTKIWHKLNKKVLLPKS